MQGCYLAKYQPAISTMGILGYAGFVIGSALYFIGAKINRDSDETLINLRAKPSEDGEKYKIPHGGMFEYVSGANFFGEILEWIGFAIACQNWPSFAFAFFTCSNIGPRALQHHQ
ncbi:hypothetical protein WR25_10564 [Diploscapter pachys]|uniref:3-oxo-5-alpha-steroid 4-dehydrogenase C-terminal domain-containing protein n=1 Tax=Diploscapter pachys TaxID=2018661 RepID=A0A2A2JTH7_9BILA|nr:hypothetical protein WR25_10564 [Diploscapter pachys]